MLKAPFIFNTALLIFLTIQTPAFVALAPADAEDKKIVITSETLTAYNKSGTAVFEGSVMAKTDDMTIYSDTMTVFYDDTGGNVTKMHVVGNVRVHKEERAIFSKEATYFADGEKIVFTGDPKAVEGENVISGKRITYFLKDDRAVVEGSNVVLRSRQGQK